MLRLLNVRQAAAALLMLAALMLPRTDLGAVVDVCRVEHVGEVLQAHVQPQLVRLQEAGNSSR